MNRKLGVKPFNWISKEISHFSLKILIFFFTQRIFDVYYFLRKKFHSTFYSGVNASAYYNFFFRVYYYYYFSFQRNVASVAMVNTSRFSLRHYPCDVRFAKKKKKSSRRVGKTIIIKKIIPSNIRKNKRKKCFKTWSNYILSECWWKIKCVAAFFFKRITFLS